MPVAADLVVATGWHAVKVAIAKPTVAQHPEIELAATGVVPEHPKQLLVLVVVIVPEAGVMQQLAHLTV